MTEPFRVARCDDLKLIAALDRACIPDAKLSRRHLEGSMWWVATRGGAPAGYAALFQSPETRLWWLIRAGVLPTFRGAGLQRRLIRVRLAAAKRLGAQRAITYIAAHNIGSARSLISCGFSLVPTHIEDFLTFERKLT